MKASLQGLTLPVEQFSSKYFDTYLIGGGVQPEQVAVAPLLTGLGIAAVHVLGRRAFQHGGQQDVRGGVLEVKDAGGPAPPGSLVQADRAPLRIILPNTRAMRSCVVFPSLLPGKHAITKCSQ